MDTRLNLCELLVWIVLLIRFFDWKPRVINALLVDENNPEDGESASVETGNVYQPPRR